MISNKTHLEKKKKKEKLALKIIFNSQYFQQHFRHLGQIVIEENMLKDKKKIEVAN